MTPLVSQLIMLCLGDCLPVPRMGALDVFEHASEVSSLVTQPLLPHVHLQGVRCIVETQQRSCRVHSWPLLLAAAVTPDASSVGCLISFPLPQLLSECLLPFLSPLTKECHSLALAASFALGKVTKVILPEEVGARSL